MSWGARELWEVEDPEVAESWLLSRGPAGGAGLLLRRGRAWGNQVPRVRRV